MVLNRKQAEENFLKGYLLLCSLALIDCAIGLIQKTINIPIILIEVQGIVVLVLLYEWVSKREEIDYMKTKVRLSVATAEIIIIFLMIVLRQMLVLNMSYAFIIAYLGIIAGIAILAFVIEKKVKTKGRRYSPIGVGVTSSISIGLVVFIGNIVRNINDIQFSKLYLCICSVISAFLIYLYMAIMVHTQSTDVTRKPA